MKAAPRRAADPPPEALFRPIKKSVTVRIDADILAWLKAKGGRYQTQMNAALRGVMLAERKR